MSKKIIVLVGLLLLVLGAALWVSINQYRAKQIPPQVVNVYPAMEQIEVNRLPEITITFDQPISAKQVKLSAQPTFEYQQLKVDDPKKLKYLPKAILQGKTTYHLSLKFAGGTEYVWSFTTTETEAGAVPGWQDGFQKLHQEYRQEHPLEEVNIYNAIVEKMPYYASTFWIEYSLRAKIFSVHLCKAPYETTQKEALNWFNQQGLNKLVKIKPQIEWLSGCEPPKIIPQNLPTP